MIRVESPDLVQYLAQFGLDLSDVRPQQTFMFLAARNAAHYLDDLEVPIGVESRRTSDASLLEREDESILDVIASDDRSLESHLPADEMDVRLIRSTEDLPRIFPLEWLWEVYFPGLFYAKLAQRELLMPEWQRAEPGAGELAQEIFRREVVEDSSIDESPRLHAYVLLDTSTTMQDHDRRGIIARGLALEFLRRSHRQGARLLLRPFTDETGELSVGYGWDDFLAITRRLIELPNAGQTRIQAALEQVVQDLRGAGPCLGANILLITDGISRLSQNPLTREELHTFILGDLYDEQRAAGAIATLKEWSRTFRRVWQTRFPEILTPTQDDCRQSVLFLQSALDGRSDVPGGNARLRRVLENSKALLREFKRSLARGTPLPPDIRALEGQLDELEHTLPPESAPAPAAPARQPSAHGRRRWSRAWFATRHRDSGQETIDLWELIRLAAFHVWQWTRRQYYRLFRRF
ncbi:MAG: VWA domain-containing protein [Pirellulales bacterium]|nr:VWA domain-containing protein [Pirellulales bacterium]